MVGKYGPLVGAIDEGTSSTRFLVFAAKTSEVITYHQLPLQLDTPHEGWVEQDAEEILKAVKSCIDYACDNLTKLSIDPADIVSVGITNQRETTVVWDKITGKPFHKAIVWMDVRTAETVDKILSSKKKSTEYLKPLCGLPLSTYFSVVKLLWMIDHVPEVSKAIAEGRCMFGTIDTWLIWNLTGGINGGLYITDCTNASRTMLMNIETLQWDPQLCNFFNIPMSLLPEIRSCSEIYGPISDTALKGIPIAGCLGDQQAALLGQMCLRMGQAKSTYGTGCFLLYNTGTAVTLSTHGLITTVGFKLGKDKPTIYALEGSVAIAGAGINWLRDNLEIIKNARDSQKIAESVPTTGEVYFVPAFSGLYAPYWRKDARSVICGITEETKSGHIVRATLEAVCFQIRDILNSMTLDCGFPLTKLLVDGGMTANNLLMQIQADLCGIPVVRPLMTETTALGAAMAAGYAEGINVWNIEGTLPVSSDTFQPSITEDARDIRYAMWKMAINRSLDWIERDDSEDSQYRRQRLIGSIPASFFLSSSLMLLIISRILVDSK